MSQTLIFLTGAVGVGKTAAAGYLMRRGYQAMAFADPVKAAAAAAFHLGSLWLTDEYKNKLHPFWNMTPREMFQRIGTEAFQTEFGRDVWIRHLQLRLEHLSQNAHVVITDVRPGKDGVQLEAEFARQHGVMVHVIGPSRREQSATQQAHSSNGQVPFQDGDLYLYNTGTLLDLQRRVDELLEILHAR